MAGQDATKIDLGPCVIEVDGTDIGFSEGDVIARFTPGVVPVVVAQHGQTPLDYVSIGDLLEAEVNLAQHDLAVLAEVMPLGAVEASSYTGFGRAPGKDLSDEAQMWEFIPIKDGTKDETRRIMIHKGVATVGPEVTFSAGGEKRTFPVTVSALADLTKATGDRLGRIYAPA